MKSAQAMIEQLRKGGKPVVGCFPLYPPLELMHSMGLLPVVLWGLRDSVSDTRDADRHVQPYACSVARQLAQFVIADGPGLLDGLFFYNACDTLRNLPELLREGIACSRRITPPMFRVHVPMKEDGASGYLASEIGNLIKALQASYDVSFSEERFARSVSLYERARWLCRRLEDAVAEGVLTFAGFSAALARANFLAVEDQIALLESTLADCEGSITQPSATRVIASGILPPPPVICDLIEQAGLRVAGNDIASMHRSYAFSPEVWDDVRDYYVAFYRDHFPCTTLLHTADRRVDAVVDIVSRRDADAFVFVGEKFCEYEYFELPYLEQQLKESGVPVLSIEVSIDDDGSAETFRTRIDAFAELLSGREGRHGA